jgi:hypothetical protein
MSITPQICLCVLYEHVMQPIFIISLCMESIQPWYERPSATSIQFNEHARFQHYNSVNEQVRFQQIGLTPKFSLLCKVAQDTVLKAAEGSRTCG